MQKRLFAVIIVLFAINNLVWSQNDNRRIRIDGLYVAKTKEIDLGESKIEIYTYLRFYDDGSVYTQTVGAYAPEEVSKWFGKNGKFSSSGKYQVAGDSLIISVNNSKSLDKELEGNSEISFNGTIGAEGNLSLEMIFSEEDREKHEFTFVGESTEFSVYFQNIDKKIIIPGTWRQQQIIEGGQVFIINDDSTTIGIVMYRKEQLPVFDENQSSFETAKAYYTWDSEYLAKEKEMKVSLLEENESQSYVIWKAVDKYNNNFFLFGCDEELIFNFMIYGDNMSQAEKMNLLKEIFKENN